MKGLTTEGTERATPEVDMAERMAFGQEYMVPAEFARKLERERNELLAYLDAAHYATCNAELRRERDEARREVDRYREEKDLSPMSWDT